MDNENKNLTEEQPKTSEEPEVILPKKQKLRSKYRAKYGIYATAITAIVIAAAILLNIVMGVLNNKYPISIDMSASGNYTVNPENTKFLKEIDYDVELNILFTEEMYQDSTYVGYYHTIADQSNGSYYKQTVQLLKQYKKYNSHITVNFIDPYGNDINTIIQEYTAAGINMNYGDILVKCYTNGKDNPAKLGIITFEECYELEEDDSTYAYTGTKSYTMVGNNIESAVANGIFKTSNLNNMNVAVITAGSSVEYVSYLKELAEDNALKFTTCEKIDGTDFSKFNVMIICSPSADYKESEVKAIENWLKQDGKTLFYFASAASPNLPNLYAMLEEWGIEYKFGYKYYSTNEVYYDKDNTNIYLSSTLTDYTKNTDTGAYTFIANNMVPLKAVYENEPNGGNRKVTTVIETEDSSVYQKPDGNSNWKATGSGEQQPVALMSKREGNGKSSYICAFSSVDFITNSSIVSKSENGNLRVIIDIINTTARNTKDQYIMDTRVIGDTSGAFTKDTNQAQSNIIFIVFILLIPATFIALAIIIFIKRKNY